MVMRKEQTNSLTKRDRMKGLLLTIGTLVGTMWVCNVIVSLLNLL